ncbi:Nudix-like NDP and NTP phosphohydrolase NudJ [hydrothermal vent metagenome]|uniref:Phosphatase NudJ n=1 Tax=hydrothermal vent metagenome TaxID=652676 RepID=A0A3B0Z3K5_9ZZZZ
MIWKPRATVAVICERNRHFLMVEERVHGQIRFNQPAGHLEDNESLIDAAIRECREETACLFQPRALIGLYRWRNTSNNDTYLRATFSGDCTDADAEQALDDDIIAAHWLTLDEIRSREAQLRSPLVLHSLQDYLAGKRYPLEILVDV